MSDELKWAQKQLPQHSRLWNFNWGLAAGSLLITLVCLDFWFGFPVARFLGDKQFPDPVVRFRLPREGAIAFTVLVLILGTVGPIVLASLAVALRWQWWRVLVFGVALGILTGFWYSSVRGPREAASQMLGFWLFASGIGAGLSAVRRRWGC